MWSDVHWRSPPCAACERDRRHCLARGWRRSRRHDGTIELVFACASLDVQLLWSPRKAVFWVLAVAAEDGGFEGRERGYSRQLLEAARDLADALRRAGEAGIMGEDEIATAIIVAGRRRNDTGPAGGGRPVA